VERMWEITKKWRGGESLEDENSAPAKGPRSREEGGFEKKNGHRIYFHGRGEFGQGVETSDTKSFVSSIKEGRKRGRDQGHKRREVRWTGIFLSSIPSIRHGSPQLLARYGSPLKERKGEGEGGGVHTLRFLL